MPTNTTIFMSLKYSSLRICNVDDAKVVDRICTCSKLIFQPESNKHRTETGNQKQVVWRQEIKTNRVVQRRRNQKNKRKKTKNMWKSIIQLESKEKQFRGVILTLNHPSLIDKKKKGMTARVWGEVFFFSCFHFKKITY